MNQAQNRDRIVEYLRIKPISHGQVYTFQIAVPESEVVEIPYPRSEYLRRSLIEQGTNLIPLIVRRTEAYSEEEDYEVVYGVDWCVVAKELDIEKLWVWVFDMTDQQAAAAKEEMQQLLGSSDSIPVAVQPNLEETESTKTVLQKLDKSFQQVETLHKKIDQVTISVKKLEERESKQTSAQDKLESLANQVEQIAEAVTRFETLLSNLPKQTLQKSSDFEAQLKDYKKMTVAQLQVIASELNIKGRSKMKRSELIAALQKADSSQS